MKGDFYYDCIIDILSTHVGMENGISTDLLVQELIKEGFNVSRSSVRNDVNFVRDNFDYPVWYFKSCGYFIISNEHERSLVKKSIHKHISTLYSSYRFISSFDLNSY